MLRFICCLWFLFIATWLQAADEPLPIEIYVDGTNGNDSQPGTKASPVKTIVKGQELARAQLAKGPRNVDVHVETGNYRLTEPLIFDTRDSAAEEHGVWYFGTKTTISGGKEITGWKQVGKLWQAEIPEVRAGKWSFRELFVGDERRPRARHPNEGYFRIDKAGADRRTSFTFKPGDLKYWPGIENLEFVMLHDWSISRVNFASIDATKNEATLANPVGFPAPHYAMDHFEKQPRYFVENALELVDSPGEWFLDVKTGVLSYMPKSEEIIKDFIAIAPYATALIQASGNSKTGEPLRGLQFEGFSFEHCRWDTPANGYAEGQATKHDPRDGISKPGAMNMIPAAVTFDLAENCSIDGCEFRNLGGSGLWLRQEVFECDVFGCEFKQIAGNGIMLGEPNSRSKPTNLRSNLMNGVCRKNRIDRNEVSNCGQLYYGAVGIWVGIAAESLIQENKLHHVPYTGISVGWKWDPLPTGCEKNMVFRNNIHDVLQVLSDGGGIYTLGHQPQTELVENIIYNVPTNAGRAESNGIFMDEGSSEMLVEGNKIYNIAKSPIRFHKAINIHLKKNQLAHADGVPMFRYNNADPQTMQLEDNERIGNDKGEFKEGTADKR